MPFEDSIQYLLVLFLEYKRARSERERSRLEAEILQLFDTLGASLTPELLNVRGEFERLRSVALRKDSESALVREDSAKKLRSAANRFFRDRLATFEKVPDAPVLSWGAREILRVPIVEVYESAEGQNPRQADRSLNLIAQSLREEPYSSIEGHGRFRTSIAVIRAYAKNFCNIPPFCSGRNDESRQ